METNKLHKGSFLILRIFSSLIFLVAGFNHLFNTAGPTARLEKSPMGQLFSWMAPAETLVLLAGIGLLLGGLALLIGYRTRLAALLLISILIPITLSVQIMNPAGMGPMFKNIALLGVLIFFSLNGALYFGLDQLLENRKLKLGSVSGLRSFPLVLLLGSALAFSACQTEASETPQTEQQQTQKYAVLISQPPHLKAAVNTAQTISPESDYHRESFVIMACGKSVQAFVKGKEMAEAIENGKKAGVTYRLCGFSLQKFGIKDTELVEGVEIVPNGLTHMFELQRQGYSTVEL